MPQEKTLPHNLEAERAVLAAMMMDKEAASVGIEMLRSNGFYNTAHQKIFDALADLFNQPDQTIDLTTLSEELRRRGDLQGVGGVAGLATILQSVATSANISYHAQIVREKALTRQLIKLCADLVEKGYNESVDTATLIEEAEQKIFRLAEQRTTRGFVAVKDLMGTVIDEIEKAWKGKTAVTGLATGFKKLDTLTAGFQKSNLIVLAARPSVGKTAFALNIAQNSALKSKTPVAIFSLEMSADEILKRMLCSEAQVDLARVRSGFINKEDFSKLSKAALKLYEAPIYIDDTPGLTINEVRARARRLCSEVQTLGMVVIDYIQLMSVRERVENRQQEVSLISRSLKAMARDLNVPVLALSQLSRAIERRDDHLPRLSDLRESGAIEQDADVVMFIHRDITKSGQKQQGEGESDEEDPGEAMAKLIIGKQRNGPLGTIDLFFIKRYTRFESPAPEYADITPF